MTRNHQKINWTFSVNIFTLNVLKEEDKLAKTKGDVGLQDFASSSSSSASSKKRLLIDELSESSKKFDYDSQMGNVGGRRSSTSYKLFSKLKSFLIQLSPDADGDLLLLEKVYPNNDSMTPANFKISMDEPFDPEKFIENFISNINYRNINLKIETW